MSGRVALTGRSATTASGPDGEGRERSAMVVVATGDSRCAISVAPLPGPAVRHCGRAGPPGRR